MEISISPEYLQNPSDATNLCKETNGYLLTLFDFNLPSNDESASESIISHINSTILSDLTNDTSNIESIKNRKLFVSVLKTFYKAQIVNFEFELINDFVDLIYDINKKISLIRLSDSEYVDVWVYLIDKIVKVVKEENVKCKNNINESTEIAILFDLHSYFENFEKYLQEVCDTVEIRQMVDNAFVAPYTKLIRDRIFERVNVLKSNLDDIYISYKYNTVSDIPNECLMSYLKVSECVNALVGIINNIQIKEIQKEIATTISDIYRKYSTILMFNGTYVTRNPNILKSLNTTALIARRDITEIFTLPSMVQMYVLTETPLLEEVLAVYNAAEADIHQKTINYFNEVVSDMIEKIFQLENGTTNINNDDVKSLTHSLNMIYNDKLENLGDVVTNNSNFNAVLKKLRTKLVNTLLNYHADLFRGENVIKANRFIQDLKNEVVIMIDSKYCSTNVESNSIELVNSMFGQVDVIIKYVLLTKQQSSVSLEEGWKKSFHDVFKSYNVYNSIYNAKVASRALKIKIADGSAVAAEIAKTQADIAKTKLVKTSNTAFLSLSAFANTAVANATEALNNVQQKVASADMFK